MKALAAGVLLPLALGLALGILAFTVGSPDLSTPDDDTRHLAVLSNAENALRVQQLLLILSRDEVEAFQTGGLRAQPLEASPTERLLALSAYRDLESYLEHVSLILDEEGRTSSLLDELLSLWSVYLRLSVSWLELQQDLENDSGFIKYLERPLKSDRPYLVELDRLLARGSVERARAMGGIVIGQRSLVWRRGAEISAAALAR